MKQITLEDFGIIPKQIDRNIYAYSIIQGWKNRMIREERDILTKTCERYYIGEERDLLYGQCLNVRCRSVEICY